MKKVIVLLLPMLLTATMMRAQTFAQCVNKAEARINKLKEVEELLVASIKDTKKIEATANMTLNPQQYIDFVLVRYLRNMRKVKLAQMLAATQAANSLCTFVGKADIVNQAAVSEGIARYTEMASFYYEWNKDVEKQFFNNFSNYLNNYGYDCEDIFREDDEELSREYEVY